MNVKTEDTIDADADADSISLSSTVCIRLNSSGLMSSISISGGASCMFSLSGHPYHHLATDRG